MTCAYGFGTCGCYDDTGSWEFSADITFGEGTKYWGVDGITISNLRNLEKFPFARAPEATEYDDIIDQTARQLGYFPAGRGPSANGLYTFRNAYLAFTRAIKSGSVMVMTVRQSNYGQDDFPRGVNPGSVFDKNYHSIGCAPTPFAKHLADTILSPTTVMFAPLKTAADQGAISQVSFQIQLREGAQIPTGEFLLVTGVDIATYGNGPVTRAEQIFTPEERDQDEKGGWNAIEFDKTINGRLYLGHRQFREQVGPAGTRFEIRGTVFEPE
jgi:hypothetical protein